MKILVGYDQSNPGKETLTLTRERANVFEASIDVVFVMAMQLADKVINI